jgi:DNA-directed RNA polymerase subunit N (RpoN/RPB10)
MLYMFCPSCRELLADKQKYYERKLSEICQMEEMREFKSMEEVDIAKQNLVNSLGLKRYCCKQRIMTYVRAVDIVK